MNNRSSLMHYENRNLFQYRMTCEADMKHAMQSAVWDQVQFNY